MNTDETSTSKGAIFLKGLIHTAFVILCGIYLVGIGGCSSNDSPEGSADDSTATTTGMEQEEEAAASFDEAEPVEDVEATYAMKLTPKVGEVYSYRYNNKGKTTIDGMTNDQDVTYDYTLTISDINDDGSIVADMRYTRIRATTVIPAQYTQDSTEQTATYDSEQKSDSVIPGTEQYEAIIGKRVILTISNEGKVNEVSNLDPVVNAAIKLAGAKPDSVPPRMVAALRQQIQAQMFQTVLETMFQTVLPDSAVKVGSEWQSTDSLPLLGIPSKSTYMCKLVEVKEMKGEKVGQIHVELVTEFPQKKLDSEQMTVKIDEVDVDGTGTGLYNMATGFPVRKSSKIQFVLKGTGTAKVGPGKGKSQGLTQRLNTTNSLVRTGYKPAGS